MCELHGLHGLKPMDHGCHGSQPMDKPNHKDCDCSIWDDSKNFGDTKMGSSLGDAVEKTAEYNGIANIIGAVGNLLTGGIGNILGGLTSSSSSSSSATDLTKLLG